MIEPVINCATPPEPTPTVLPEPTTVLPPTSAPTAAPTTDDLPALSTKAVADDDDVLTFSEMFKFPVCVAMLTSPVALIPVDALTAPKVNAALFT